MKPDHYVPTLCHIKAEMEDGSTPDGDTVRFNYQDQKFPQYSWKGFVAINDKQVSYTLY